MAKYKATEPWRQLLRISKDGHQKPPEPCGVERRERAINAEPKRRTQAEWALRRIDAELGPALFLAFLVVVVGLCVGFMLTVLVVALTIPGLLLSWGWNWVAHETFGLPALPVLKGCAVFYGMILLGRIVVPRRGVRARRSTKTGHR